MVDVLLTIHKVPQCGAPTPPRHCRRVYKGKQETIAAAATGNDGIQTKIFGNFCFSKLLGSH